MSDKSLEDMFTSALMKESANKLQDAVNDKLKELENEVVKKINKFEDKDALQILKGK